MAIVYRHRRLDTNEIFYIGITKKLSRPNSKFNRNKYWHNIVNKYEYSVEIIQENLSWQDACELECFLILEYGRKDFGIGKLVNMTSGGDGVPNIIITEENRIKSRNAMLGRKHSEQSKLKMSHSRKGILFSKEHKNNLSKSKQNVIVSLETKVKLSIIHTGKKKSLSHAQNIAKAEYKKVLDKITEQKFESLKEVTSHFGFEYKQLSRWLNGSRKNKTNLIYI